MKPKQFVSYILLIIIPLLAFFPVTAGLHPLVHDIITTAFPWRFFTGECLRHQMLPLWNPYQHLGYPIHADPQSGAWYLPVWIVGSLAGYDFYTLSFEFLGHIVLAGLGMRWLSLTLKHSDKTATLLGLAYCCSGFFIGNAQHLPFVISATWLPFILASFINMAAKPAVKWLFMLPVFLWLSLTGGYPGFMIILAYLLAVLMVFFGIRNDKGQDRKKLLRFYGFVLASGLMTILLALPFLISFFQSLPHITRGGGTSLQQALVCPYSPQSLISLIFPMAAAAEPSFYDSDLSMTNSYIGIIPLILAFLSLGRKDQPMKWVFLGFALFSLLAAMGSYLPVRAFLYHYFPLMNYFRMPSIFRVFFILGLLVAAGFSLDRLYHGDRDTRIRFVWIFRGMTILTGLTFIFSLLFADHSLLQVYHLFFETSGNTVKVIDNLMINSAILFILALVFNILLFRKGLWLSRTCVILVFVIADLLVSANLNGPFTVYSEKSRVADLNQRISSLPAGFPAPGFYSVFWNRDAFQSYKDLWINVNCFYKKIGYEGYNPFSLRSFEDLVYKRPEVFEKVIQHPPYFLKHEPENQPEIVYFDPNTWMISVNTPSQDTLCLLQNAYPGWKLWVDQRPANFVLYEGTFLAVPLQAGIRTVAFRYEPDLVRLAWVVSVSALAVMIIMLIISIILKRKDFFS